MSRYQKGKTNLDFTEATDSEWQRHQLGRMQVCTSLQTDNHASTPSLTLSFLQAGCPSCRPTNSVKALKAPSEAISCQNYKRQDQTLLPVQKLISKHRNTGITELLINVVNVLCMSGLPPIKLQIADSLHVYDASSSRPSPLQFTIILSPQ